MMEVHESLATFSEELVSEEPEQSHFPTGRTKLLANLPVHPPSFLLCICKIINEFAICTLTAALHIFAA